MAASINLLIGVNLNFTLRLSAYCFGKSVAQGMLNQVDPVVAGADKQLNPGYNACGRGKRKTKLRETRRLCGLRIGKRGVGRSNLIKVGKKVGQRSGTSNSVSMKGGRPTWAHSKLKHTLLKKEVRSKDSGDAIDDTLRRDATECWRRGWLGAW